jgi:hypothetical protein
VRAWPLFSSAAIVLTNVGRDFAVAMLSTSAACSLIAASKAGEKCSGRIFPKGGSPKGSRHGASSGFFAGLLAFAALAGIFLVAV